ncbi:MAG: cytochrome P450 [Oricola sp.]
MSENLPAPKFLGRMESIGVLARFLSRPLPTLRRLHETHGPFVFLTYPHSTRRRPQMLACISDPALYRAVFSDTAAWRPVNVAFRGLRNQAATRLSFSMTRLRDEKHAHYRRLMTPPLSKTSVTAMSGSMSEIAARHVSGWPKDEPTDFIPLGSTLMQDLAISLLFGHDHARALPIASMINVAVESAWPIPGPAYLRWLRVAPKLERAIIEWGETKRGNANASDLFSILMNNPNDEGGPPDVPLIGGLLTFTFGAAYETCQNALAWTLVLLAQHPQVAAELAAEIDDAVGRGATTGAALESLPVLDGVTKEGMRLFAPVSIQFRRTRHATRLGPVSVPERMRVLVSAFLINRNPEIYPEPERFLPERWRTLKVSPYDYTVFGAGGRMCPGFAFGIQMVKTALVAILTKYSLEIPAGSTIDHKMTITVAPHPHLPIVFRERTARPQAHHLAGTVNELVELPAAN